MTGVRARLKRILGINPETPGTMRYPKKSWSLLIPPPCLPRSVRLPMCFGACEHQHGTPDQRGADYAETLETCRSSYSPQTAIWTGSGTGSAQIQLQFSSGTRNFRKLQLYLRRSAPKQGPAVRCLSVRATNSNSSGKLFC